MNIKVFLFANFIASSAVFASPITVKKYDLNWRITPASEKFAQIANDASFVILKQRIYRKKKVKHQLIELDIRTGNKSLITEYNPYLSMYAKDFFLESNKQINLVLKSGKTLVFTKKSQGNWQQTQSALLPIPFNKLKKSDHKKPFPTLFSTKNSNKIFIDSNSYFYRENKSKPYRFYTDSKYPSTGMNSFPTTQKFSANGNVLVINDYPLLPLQVWKYSKTEIQFHKEIRRKTWFSFLNPISFDLSKDGKVLAIAYENDVLDIYQIIEDGITKSKEINLGCSAQIQIISGFKRLLFTNCKNQQMIFDIDSERMLFSRKNERSQAECSAASNSRLPLIYCLTRSYHEPKKQQTFIEIFNWKTNQVVFKESTNPNEIVDFSVSEAGSSALFIKATRDKLQLIILRSN